jgi:transposase
MGQNALARGKKNARRRRAWILFYDESGISQRPSIRRTWAPRGNTPVLIHRFTWKKLLVSVALGFRWDGRRSQLWFRTAPGSCNADRVLAFLYALTHHVAGRRVTLVWDQLPAHKSRRVHAYLAAHRAWLRVEWLPGYAPELNPAEQLWGNVKGQELANACPDDLAGAATALRRGMARIRRSPTLSWGFLRHAGLSF